MGAEIITLNNGERVAYTSRAYNAIITHELMRMYTLSFNLVNKDNTINYINPSAQFIADGQLFDIVGYDINSGNENVTAVSCTHVAYRLNNYKLNIPNYAYVGTIRKIVEDLLNLCVDDNGNKASSEFKIGTLPDLGTVSFSLNNADAVTAKYALLALKDVGAESDYDNFTINFARQIGTGNTKTFKFGVDLCRLRRAWTKENGSTYEVEIANLQRLQGHESDRFDVGDYVTVQDDLIGDSVTKRVVTYNKCLDDPTRDSITLGVFIANISSCIAAMSVDVKHSVKAGENYNNCSITHHEGFKSTANVGGKEIVTTLNATEGLKVTVDGVANLIVSNSGHVLPKYIGNTENAYSEIGELATGYKGICNYNNKYMSGGLIGNKDGVAVLSPQGSLALSSSDTSIYMTNANSQYVFVNDAYQTSMSYGNNELGIDNKGVYTCTNGIRKYLS